MSDLELKPCPFCGHELDELDVQMSIFGPRVHCWYCGAIGPDPFPRFVDSEGKTYEQIVKSVEISTATISRINRCIQYGSGGYRQTIARLPHKDLP